MNTKPNKWELGAFTRRLILLPALVVVVSLAFTAAASADQQQTTVPFQASVSNTNQATPASCPTAYYCGYATIPGYGNAFWSFNVNDPAGPIPLSYDCYLYVGTSTLTLNSDPGGVLVLNENATGCQPGNSGNTPQFWTTAFGHPFYATGTWTVNTKLSTGQFKGLTGGSGTDVLRSDGAPLEAAWTGTVTTK